MHVCKHSHNDIHLHVCMRTNIHSNELCKHVHVHTHTYACMHTPLPTYTSTHTCTLANTLKWLTQKSDYFWALFVNRMHVCYAVLCWLSKRLMMFINVHKHRVNMCRTKSVWQSRRQQPPSPHVIISGCVIMLETILSPLSFVLIMIR